MQIMVLDEKKRTDIQNKELEILVEIDRICRKYDIKYTLAYGTLIGAVRHNGFIPWDDDIDICMLRNDYEKFKRICKTELSDKYFYQSNDTDPEYYHLFDKIRANETIFKESFLAKWNIHHGVYVDIFPLDYIPNSFLKRTFQYYKFHFYRTGLMSKYLMTDARHGIKKYGAMLLKILYAPFSLNVLYSGACKTASYYKNCPETKISSFCSAFKKRDTFDRSIFESFIEVPFANKGFYIIENYDHVLSGLYGEYMKLPPENQRGTRHDLVELELG